MTDTLPARSTKRKTRAAPPARRPGATVSQQILEAVAATKERRGVSMPALKKVLSGRGYDVARNNWRVNQAVRSLVTKGSLLQATGTGASGSFRLSKTWGDREEEEKKKKPKREPAAAARERRRRMKQRAARKPARKAAPRSRGSPRKTKKHGAARKGARRATARKPKGRKAARAGGKGKRQRAKPRKLVKQPEQEAVQTPAQEETSLSEKESQVCSEQEDSS